MTERVQPCAVLSERDQQPLQLDQQGEEATGSCGPWIGKEQELTRVGGERGSEQPLTAPVVELTWDDVGRRMADVIAAAVYGPRGELRERVKEGKG